MSTKDVLIRVLEENRDRAVSGQELADTLHITRAAVWKAVRSLQEDGYRIEAVRNRGYRLAPDTDVLSAQGVALYLPEKYRDSPVTVLQTVDSTNSAAKRLATEGAPHRTLVLAEKQTAGRGRRGRSFYSPAGTGLYMSVLLRPDSTLQDALPVTVAAAVAVCRAAEALTGKRPEIKWVNDLFLDGRKISGILTEAISDFESGMAEAVIVGIGVNLRTTDFPDELAGVAGSLQPGRVTRNELAARIAAELFRLAENLSSPALMEEYRARSLILGKEIAFRQGDALRRGRAAAIDDEGCLLVETDGGQIVLKAGEVSVVGSVL